MKNDFKSFSLCEKWAKIIELFFSYCRPSVMYYMPTSESSCESVESLDYYDDQQPVTDNTDETTNKIASMFSVNFNNTTNPTSLFGVDSKLSSSSPTISNENIGDSTSIATTGVNPTTVIPREGDNGDAGFLVFNRNRSRGRSLRKRIGRFMRKRLLCCIGSDGARSNAVGGFQKNI